ncbi:reverse transcriptase domain-containing protein [Tanacetum coccineum]
MSNTSSRNKLNPKVNDHYNIFTRESQENLPFELMCDASDFAISAVLGQRKMKHFQPIHYASKMMTEAQIHYTMTEKEMLAVVYAFEKFRPYLVLSKSIMYTDHLALKYLMNKQDAKPRLLSCGNTNPGRGQRDVVNEEKETADDKVSTEDALSTAQQKVSTDKEKVSTDRPNRLSTDRPKVNTDKEKDSTVAQMKDEEMARKVQEDWEAEEEVKKLAEEEAIKTALSNEYDFIQARIEADRLLALRLQDEEREQFTVEERANSLIWFHWRMKELIRRLNEGVKDPDQKSLKKRVVKETSKTEDTAKVPAKVDVTEQGTKKRKGGHMKMIARKRKIPQRC